MRLLRVGAVSREPLTVTWRSAWHQVGSTACLVYTPLGDRWPGWTIIRKPRGRGYVFQPAYKGKPSGVPHTLLHGARRYVGYAAEEQRAAKGDNLVP